MSDYNYKLTLEVFYRDKIEDEDGNEVFLDLAGWQENYTQFTDMFTYPRVVSVERLSENTDGVD